ncbi:DUF6448 family protein [Marinobacter sp.]|uniref:DUF6448 family protein n=1 Tax=Marinobacter sp. TaxID=50741 RepID=UPI002355BB71|nr:DUF6448 family protein [Marinobacter sp.]
MTMKKQTTRLLGLTLLAGSVLWSSATFAHCDSLDGPVIEDAREALADNRIDPVLKWVKPADAQQLTATFRDTLKVRELNGDAQALADRYFFETLVRLHRAAEGAPYDGLKPAGSASAAAKAADKALAAGNANALAEKLGQKVTEFVKNSFQASHRGLKAEDVIAGREFVANYVQYVHSVEAIHDIVAGNHDGH